MSAITTLIIRHGEKPESGVQGKGVTPDGVENDQSLLVRGWQRAGAWAALFGFDQGSDAYPKPAVIYAVNPDEDPVAGDDPPSRRPLQTVTPLADRLHLSPRVQFGQDQGQNLVAEVVALTGVVLICWEHKRIGKTNLPALLTGQNLPGVPAKWDRDRFDVALRLDRAVPGAPWSFRQMFPRLLAAIPTSRCEAEQEGGLHPILRDPRCERGHAALRTASGRRFARLCHCP